MEKVYEVSADDGSRVDLVTGHRAFIDSGFLHIQDAQGRDVAIFAKFDSVIAKPQAKTE